MEFLMKYGPILIVIVVLIVLFVIFTTIFLKRSRIAPQKPFNSEVAEQIIAAIGKNNIKNVSLANSRLKILVQSLKQIDRKKLKETNFPAIVKGKEVTLLIRYYPEEIHKYIKGAIK